MGAISSCQTAFPTLEHNGRFTPKKDKTLLVTLAEKDLLGIRDGEHSIHLGYISFTVSIV